MKAAFLKILFVCLTFFLDFSAQAQGEFCNIKNTTFLFGEKLSYRIYYNMAMIWVQAGEAHFTVKNEQLNKKLVYHFVGDGNTLKAYEWFYKVQDIYESYVDAETMQPLRAVRNVSEGSHRVHNDATFNYTTLTATSNDGVCKIPACVQDVLSAIFFARNLDFSKFAVGAKIPFNMYLDNRVYPLFIRYLGKEKITTRFGTFNAVKFGPLLINGTLFTGGEKMTVWVSDDANHVPVRVESPITIGSIKVDLVAYENLRYPFRALLGLN